MFHGVLALLERTLRADSKSLVVHVSRAACGLLLMGSQIMDFGFITDPNFGAHGLRWLRSILIFNCGVVTLVGIGLFPSAITEEKEEGNLGLMHLAGVSPLSILIGKMGGRALQALLLIAVQYPFSQLAATLGGVTSNQVRCVFVGMAAYALFMAGLGLLCSTVASNNRLASTWMVVGMIAYFCIPPLAIISQQVLMRQGILSATSFWTGKLLDLGGMCLFMELIHNLNSNSNESPLSVPVISNLIASGIFFLTSWGLFGIAAREPEVEGTSRGWLTISDGSFRFFAPGRPRWNPFAWKEFHFTGGGVAAMLIRAVLYPALFPVSYVISFVFSGPPSTIWWNNPSTIFVYQFIMLMAVTTEAASLMAGTLHEEVRDKTGGPLFLLPFAMPAIVYSKFAGVLLAGLPGISCLAMVSLFTQEGWQNLTRFCSTPTGWYWLTHCVLVVHLAILCSLYMRWGFVVLAIGLAIGHALFWPGLHSTMPERAYNPFLYVGMLIVLVVCLFSHFWIQHRLRALAELG